jgi:hypothetical protein
VRTYSRQDAAKTQGRTAATSTVPAQEHRDHTPTHPGPPGDHGRLPITRVFHVGSPRSRQRLQAAVAAGGSGLARQPAVDEAEDAVSCRAEAGVQPEWPGQQVCGVEIDRDPVVVMVMGPGERSVDERVPDALAARAGQRGGGADVGLAVGAQPGAGEVGSMVSRPTSCLSRVARRWTAPASRRARCSAIGSARGRSWRGANIGGAERCWISTRARRAIVSRSPAPAIRTATAEEPRRGAAG